MTRTLKLALSAVLGVMLVTPALAQDNFPDVPENHWAYEALARMKREGLLVGYPDGLFRGGRAATRYELAVAIHATYQYLKNITDSLQEQINAIGTPGTGGVSREEFDNLKATVADLQNKVNAINPQDIADLKRMATTFERDLAAMGVDVAQMKRDLGDIADRVTALENRLPVDISGTVDFVALAGYGDDDWGGRPGITWDARPTGVDRRSGGAGVGADRDLSILHEAAITLTGANTGDVAWTGTFVTGNMFDNGGVAFGNQSAIPGVGGSPFGFAPFREGDASYYIQELSVAFGSSIYGADFMAEAGRIGYKISPYLFMRPDNTPYFANDRWDNGEWGFDGAILGFNFGSAKLNVLGGRTLGSDASGASPIVGGGGALQPMPALGFNTDQFLGAHVSVPVTDNGSLNLAYLWLDTNAPVAVADDKVEIFGGDLQFAFGPFTAKAGYAQTNTRDGDETVIDEDNAAWFAQLGYNANRWGATVGYRTIETQFMAPGDWGRIGTWWNPTDIEGFYADAHFDINNDFRLTGKVESYTGFDDQVGAGGTNSFLGEDDEITRYMAGLEYKLATNYDLLLGVEEVRMEFDDGGNLGGFGNDTVIERWYNIGFGWNINDNASFSFLWQVSDYKAREATPLFQPFPGQGFGGVAQGGLITSQLRVRF